MQAAIPAEEAQGAAGIQDANNLLITWYKKASYEVSVGGLIGGPKEMGKYLAEAIQRIIPFFVYDDSWDFGETMSKLNEVWSTTPYLILTLIYTNHTFGSIYYITPNGEIMNIDPTFMAKMFLVGLEPKELIAGLQTAIRLLPQELIEGENKELPNWSITKYLESLQYKRDSPPKSEQVVINSLICCFGLGTNSFGLQDSFLKYLDFLKKHPSLVSLYTPILQKFISENNKGVIYKNYKAMRGHYDLTLKSIAEELLKRM